MAEIERFSTGTQAVAREISMTSCAVKIAGGGETTAAIDRFGFSKDIDYLSTGGAAFLSAVEGAPLPGVAVLQNKEAAREAGLGKQEVSRQSLPG